MEETILIVLPQAPYLIILAAGFMFSLFKLKAQRIPAILVIIALMLSALMFLLSMGNASLTRYIVVSGYDTATIKLIYALVAFVFSIANSISLGLLLAAVWTGRTEK
ncbi:MAG: hypothetical protein R2684_16980 [Pyrinomonadaceae bacterium]